MSKSKLMTGDRVRTNDRYAREISRVSRSGVLERPLTWITGLWRVRLEGFERSQHVHESYLEREVTSGKAK